MEFHVTAVLMLGTPSAGAEQPSSTKQEAITGGQGWVLVNVEGKDKETKTEPETSTSTEVQEGPKLPVPSEPPHPQSSMSPAAKAIVIIDALEANKDRVKADKPEMSSLSRMRRLFSLTRKNSKKSESNRKFKSSFRNKLRLGNTHETNDKPRIDG